MKSWKRTLGAGVCTVALLAAAAPAGADQVVNNLDNTIDDRAETMNLSVDGGPVTTTIWVNATKEGQEVVGSECNIKQGQQLVLKVSPAKPGFVTVPETITITGCGIDNGAVLSVTPVAVGTIEISFSEDKSTNASGTFEPKPAKFNAVVARDTTPPRWSCSPAAASADWQAIEGSHSCTARDGSGLQADSPANFILTTSVGAGSENSGASTNSQLLCDIPGNCITAGPISGWKVDRKAPTITNDGPTASANGAGWYNTDVTNQFSASDGGSGLARSDSSSFERTTTGEGTAVKVSSGPVADAVDNLNSGIDSAAFKIDKTAPNAPIATATTNPDYIDGTIQWWKGSVTVDFESDGDPNMPEASGVDESSLSASQRFNITGAHTASGTVKDNAGNESLPGTLAVRVDATKPTASFDDCPSNPIAKGSTVEVRWSAADDLNGSGLKGTSTGSTTLDTNSAGNKLAEGPAPQDNVGNVGDAPKCFYDVHEVATNKYSSTGILQPINPDGSSVFKIKSTIPVKIKLTGDSAGITNGDFKVSLAKQGSTVTGSQDEQVISTSAHTGNTMRYDSAADQYIFNLGTSKMTTGTYNVIVDLGDGTTREAQFSLRS